MASVLVVEDRDSLRRMLTRSLEQESYEVVAVPDGEVAIERLAGEPFDLVLTDHNTRDAVEDRGPGAHRTGGEC